jgi:hypothetical protein
MNNYQSNKFDRISILLKAEINFLSNFYEYQWWSSIKSSKHIFIVQDGRKSCLMILIN